LLIKKIELGLFDHPYVDEGRVSEIFDDPVNQFLAREIARQSLVLLKNDGLLPLKKDISSLAVIGPNADSSRCFHSGYSYVSMNELLNHNAIPGTEYEHPDPALWPDLVNRIPSLLASLKTAMPDLRLAYARGCEHKGQELDIAGAVAAAQQAGAVLLVLGDISGLTPPCTTGETRDVADLRLPGLQQELAEAVLAVGKPTVVILISGRPYLLNSLTEGANAILQAWIPGQEGAAAIVEALFGDTNPAGRLPLTFPRATGQVPIYYNQKPSGGKSNWYIDYVDTAISPLYPFGHGLSYTRFDYHDFSLSRKSATAGDTLEVRVTITNTGPVSGDEVVQLYIRDEFARYPRPVKELKGFARLSLEPWESKRVVFKLPVNLLAYYDRNQRLIVEPGTVQVMVGSSSEDIHYCDRFEIVGDVEVIQDRIFVCPVVVV
jgi:beta-glucosidase